MARGSVMKGLIHGIGQTDNQCDNTQTILLDQGSAALVVTTMQETPGII